MRKSLLASVAVAAAVGFGGIAAAQSQMGGDSNKGTSSAAHEQKSGGSMSGTQSGGKTLSPSGGQSSGQSAQGMEKGKQNERLGQGANEEQKGMTRGAQEKRGEQKGAQQERGLQNQKGAQEERGTKLKGDQEQRGTSVKGAQEQRGTTTTEQSGKAGVNANVGGSRGGSVQLSEDQRSQIKTIVGREHGPRLGSNVNFDVTVGTRIPRNVHVVVLPEEIVRIVPEYRGYEYFLVGNEIVIVDPRTLEIVAIIPA